MELFPINEGENVTAKKLYALKWCKSQSAAASNGVKAKVLPTYLRPFNHKHQLEPYDDSTYA